MKKHDENKDLRSLSRVAKIDYADRSITISTSVQLGIRRLGKLDFLTNHCGWKVFRGNVQVGRFIDNTIEETSAREIKKLKKERAINKKMRK